MGRVATLTALLSLATFSFAPPAAAQEVVEEETPEPEGQEGAEEEGAPPEGETTESTESPDTTEATEAEPVSESDERARALYVEGDRLYAEGRYEEAVAAFRESYELSLRPLLLFNLANAYERIGSHREAAEALSLYLEHAEEAERITLQRRIDALRERADREQVTDVVTPVPSEPPDDTAAWVLVASGGVVAASAIVLGALSLVARGEASELCTEVGDGHICRGDARDPLDRASTLAVAADVTAAVGLVTMAVGVVLLLINRGGTEEPSTAGVTARFGGTGMWVSF